MSKKNDIIRVVFDSISQSKTLKWNSPPSEQDLVLEALRGAAKYLRECDDPKSENYNQIGQAAYEFSKIFGGE